MRKQIKKVLAYVVRRKNFGLEVLVFEHVHHPEAGIQVPAGTVNEHESLENAVLRELQEEVGLASATIKAFLGEFQYDREDRDEIHLRNVYQLDVEEKLPDTWLHKVKSHDEDNALEFKCYWVSIAVAKNILAVDQGKYLNLLVK